MRYNPGEVRWMSLNSAIIVRLRLGEGLVPPKDIRPVTKAMKDLGTLLQEAYEEYLQGGYDYDWFGPPLAVQYPTLPVRDRCHHSAFPFLMINL